MKLETKWLGVYVSKFPGGPPRIWAAMLRLGRKRAVEIRFRDPTERED
jgi:hypothetical protein